MSDDADKEPKRENAYLEVVIRSKGVCEVIRLAAEKVLVDLRGSSAPLEDDGDLVRLESVEEPECS